MSSVFIQSCIHGRLVFLNVVLNDHNYWELYPILKMFRIQSISYTRHFVLLSIVFFFLCTFVVVFSHLKYEVSI